MEEFLKHDKAVIIEVNIQNHIMECISSLNEENYENVVEDIKKVKTVFTLEQIFKTIVDIAVYRPKTTTLYSNLIESLGLDDKSVIFSYLKDRLFRMKEVGVKNILSRLIYLLHRRSLITDENIIQIVNDQNNQIYFSPLYNFFAPFLISIDHKAKHYFDDGKIIKNEWREDDWRLFKQVAERGCIENSLQWAIMNDDFDALQPMTISQDFDFLGKLNLSAIEKLPYLPADPSYLLYCTYFGSDQCFKFFLSNGAIIQKEGEGGQNFAICALAGGNYELIHIIQDNGIDTFPLDIAVNFRRIELFQWITQQYEDDILVNGALSLAVEANYIPAVLFCLEQGADINTESFEKFDATPLIRAASLRYTTMMKMLMKDDNIDVNKKDNNGSTALHHAALKQSIDEMKILFTSPKLDPNPINEIGETPLMNAIQKRSSDDIIIYLIDHGCDMDILDSSGKSALDHAADKNCVSILKILIDKGAKISNTNLLSAIDAESKEATEYLLNTNKYDINYRDEMQRTPLLFAIESQNIDIVKLIINAQGVDYTASDYKKSNGLIYAAINGDVEIFKLLYEKGVDINAGDDKGRTPLYHAADKGHLDMVKYICSLPGVEYDSSTNGFRLLAIRNIRKDIKDYLTSVIENHKQEKN